MKNKIFLIVVLAGIMSIGSCNDFLDETPNKSGSAYIYHMDQLYGLMGSSDLYLFDDPYYAAYGMVAYYWNEMVWLNDMIEISPEFYVYVWGRTYSGAYDKYCWQTEEWTDQYSMSSTWTPSWERIYTGGGDKTGRKLCAGPGELKIPDPLCGG